MAGSWRPTPPKAAAVLSWLLLGCVCVRGYPESDLVRRLPVQPPVASRQFAGTWTSTSAPGGASSTTSLRPTAPPRPSPSHSGSMEVLDVLQLEVGHSQS
uniref:Uncharacterized protein n=1 Tax=Arundo donax TaxID=35708 RepID=A0A0A9H4R7_ARUDO